jgi:EAL domain-containing protein (putative c-di-GMP-specific phosphodiesterase class I)
VREALAVSGLEPEYLVLEITETAMMRDTVRSLTVLEALRAIGVQLAIDDFGTGYSSLSYLQRFAADSIKIDRSFVAAMLTSGESAVLVQTLVRLGKALGLRTIAEGVEDPRQVAVLRAEGCDLAQGFLYHKPIEASAVLALLGSPRPDGGVPPLAAAASVASVAAVGSGPGG